MLHKACKIKWIRLLINGLDFSLINGYYTFDETTGTRLRTWFVLV